MKTIAAAAALTLLISCKQSSSVDTAGLPVADLPEARLSSVGMDSSVIYKMTEALREEKYSNVHSVLIARRGTLVYEQYFSGEDEIWGDSKGEVKFNGETLHDVRSISKSVVSACIGIAVDQGKIKEVKQNVFDFFPEYEKHKTGTRAQLTIENLLTMTSGLQWNEDIPYDNPENSEIQMTNSNDPIEYVLSRPMVADPGTRWNYNGGTTQVLAAIIKKVSGLEVDEFARVNLFEPIGITNFEWTPFPTTTVPAAASGLRLRPRDMMKFGLLYYHGGVWKGRQILSKDWVDKSFTSFISRPDGGAYGYQFWIWDDDFHGAPSPVFVAVGNGDQRIFINKQADLVVVTTAGNYNKWGLPNHPGKLLADFIYPSIKP